jgi:Holliday junction resolvase
MTEKTFSTWLVKHLRTNGWDVQRIETSTGNGVPDVNCCKNGEELWLELKCLDTVEPILRPMQYAWMLRRVKAGGTCVIINMHKRSGNIYVTYFCKDLEIKKLATGIKILGGGTKYTKETFRI